MAREAQPQPASVRIGDDDTAGFSSMPLVHANAGCSPYHASNEVFAVAWVQY
jgi:hypothetical protein